MGLLDGMAWEKEFGIGEKLTISLLELKTTIGFIYWVNETHNLRGLKNISIERYVVKLKELQKEYNLKYPNGLTGWSE